MLAPRAIPMGSPLTSNAFPSLFNQFNPFITETWWHYFLYCFITVSYTISAVFIAQWSLTLRPLDLVRGSRVDIIQFACHLLLDAHGFSWNQPSAEINQSVYCEFSWFQLMVDDWLNMVELSSPINQSITNQSSTILWIHIELPNYTVSLRVSTPSLTSPRNRPNQHCVAQSCPGPRKTRPS